MLSLVGFGSKARRGAQAGWRRLQHSGVPPSPKLMTAAAEAYAEGPTTLVRHGAYKFVIDEPPKLGGQGLGANPLTHFLGALAACTSYTLAMVTNELKLPPIARASWTATGAYDLRGLQGKGGGADADARFRSIELSGVLDTEASQEDLDRIRDQVERRCIVAATCAASGMDLRVTLKRGAVAHDCPPACELHDLSAQKGVTGKAEGGKEAAQADAPRAAAAGAGGARGLHTAAALGMANGEDVAREHLGADKEPQIQKETSEKGATETAGGAYASRDAPRAQAAQPTEGKSDEDLVREQTAEATTKPEESLHADEAVPPPPEFAEKAEEAALSGKSPLGDPDPAATSEGGRFFFSCT